MLFASSPTAPCLGHVHGGPGTLPETTPPTHSAKNQAQAGAGLGVGPLHQGPLAPRQ